MSTTNIVTAKAVRNTRKIERPRPLRQDSKRSSTIDDLINELEILHTNLSNCNFNDSVFEQLQQACNGVKIYGAQLESKYKDNLDRYFVSFRNASRDDRLDRLSRLRILEAIELRAMGWKQNDEITKYYQSKVIELENILERGPAPIVNSTGGVQQSFSSQNIPVTLTSGEILKTSGKFSKATKIPGKNYFKDEIVIRNSDSGKVMGIKGRRVHMIEELSDTIISFQRVAQGVKERLVQITGPQEQAIACAKNLIEDTIRRNASPVRDRGERVLSKSLSSNSLDSNASEDSGTSITGQDSNYKVTPIIHSYSAGDASTIRDYQYTVMVGCDAIRLSASNLDKVRTAKLVLEEYFAGQAESSGYSSCSHSFTDIGSVRRPLSMYASFGSVSPLLNSYSQNSNDEDKQFSKNSNETHSMVPLQRSKSIPMSGSASSGSSSSHSSADEETYKGESSTTEDEKAAHISDVPLKKYLNRSASASTSKDLKNATSNSRSKVDKDATSLHSASFRRAQFAKATMSNAEASKTEDSMSRKSPSLSCNGYRISYPRNFLLDCAKSPFSTLVPKDLTHIVQDLPYLFKKTPEMFDPDEYKQRVIICIPNTRLKESPSRLFSCEAPSEDKDNEHPKFTRENSV